MKQLYITKNILLTFLFAFLAVAAVKAQTDWKHGRLITSKNGHFLKYEDGTPFFWLGDTGWELFHRLTYPEISAYLDNRQKKGFNVIQAVVLAEFNGLTKPNQNGDLPLVDLDPLKPNERYFKFVDSVVLLAKSKGVYMGLLPTWGDKVTMLWGAGPVIFNKDKAYQYGLWIGKRYQKYPNIIWILGGDRPPKKDSADWTPIWRAMATGILDATQQKAFITYHPSGGENSTSAYIHNEKWLTMNMMQSGHGGGHDVPVWNRILRDWNLTPAKPTLDAEPNYEDHPVNPWPTWDPANGYYRDYDVRKQTYRSVFSGACGVTYGHHSVWQFYSPREEKINYAERYWIEAIDRPGAYQVGYLRKLVESRPQLSRIPDQSVIEKGQGEKGEYICATRDAKGRFLMVYLPVGKTITINAASVSSKKISAWWFNPQNAGVVKIGLLNNTGSMEFSPPVLGAGNDWVLVIDDPAYHYPIGM